MNANYRSVISAISLLFVLSASTSAAPGDLDPTFGSGGIVITRGKDLNHINAAFAMAIQSDGKIVVVGEGSPGTFNWDFAVVRYNTDGSLDSSFGGTGIVITQLTSNYDGASSVAIQADGKIVVAGSRTNCFCINSSFAVVRYHPNGTLDTSFNGTGIVITSVAGSWNYADSVAIQTDGKIVVFGRSSEGSNTNIAIVRYNSNGSLDTAFNGTGKLIIPGGGGNSGGHTPSVTTQTDGKVVVTESSYNGTGYDLTISRYNSNGSPDTSFNGSGKVVILGVAGSGLAIQPDGKIVVTGSSYDSSVGSSRSAVARFNPDGSPDTSFNGTGIVISTAGGGRAMAIQPDGKIVTVGTNFNVVRFNPNGSLDTTFNGADSVTQGYSIAVAIQADGNIVVAGSTDDLAYDFYDFVVARYQGNDATPAACPNLIDCADLFVRQHYRDFLGREPDAAGLAFWTGEITSCGADAGCVEVKRINVSAAFFLSIEFQETGFYALRVQRVAFGRRSTDSATRMSFGEVSNTQRQIGQGIVVGQSGYEHLLDDNQNAYASQVANSSSFNSRFPQSDAVGYVDALYASAGVTPTTTERQDAINAYHSASDGTSGRTAGLRKVADSASVRNAEFNEAFVLLQYHGYLRRNPDDDGYNFWLNKLNQFNGNYVEAEMVKAFLASQEYRRRFGQP